MPSLSAEDVRKPERLVPARRLACPPARLLASRNWAFVTTPQRDRPRGLLPTVRRTAAARSTTPAAEQDNGHPIPCAARGRMHLRLPLRTSVQTEQK